MALLTIDALPSDILAGALAPFLHGVDMAQLCGASRSLRDALRPATALRTAMPATIGAFGKLLRARYKATDAYADIPDHYPYAYMIDRHRWTARYVDLYGDDFVGRRNGASLRLVVRDAVPLLAYQQSRVDLAWLAQLGGIAVASAFALPPGAPFLMRSIGADRWTRAILRQALGALVDDADRFASAPMSFAAYLLDMAHDCDVRRSFLPAARAHVLCVQAEQRKRKINEAAEASARSAMKRRDRSSPSGGATKRQR